MRSLFLPIARCLPLLAALVLLPASASAYGIATVDESLKGTIIRWATPNITYYVDAAGTNGLTAAQSQSCMDGAFADWQAVDCSALTFTRGGTTTNKNVLPMSSGYPLYENGKVELVWINDSSWTFGQQVLGVTMVNGSWSVSGRITEGDIAFNGKDYTWNLTGTIGYWNNDMDCKSVVIHEIGHLFGLQHVLGSYAYNDPPTMLPAVDPDGRSATLSPDDEMGACFLYPVSSYYTCTKNSECPKVVGHSGQDEVEIGQIYCQSGYCQGGGGVAPNSVELGGTCRSSSDCVSGTSCTTLTSGVLICTRGCTAANDDCPDGYHCDTPNAANAVAVCVPGNKKKAIGETCSTSYECGTGFCHAAPDGSSKTCRQSCPKTAPNCPTGQTCWATSYSTMGGCYPADEVPTTLLKLGAECSYSAQCASGLCYSEPGDTVRCRQKCDVASPSCYANYRCKDIGNLGACIPNDGLKDDGTECEADAECRNQACMELPSTGKSYCRTTCELTTWICVWGWSCVAYGSSEIGACMPSVDRKATGTACTSDDECTSLMCRDYGEAGKFCTQNCVDGWCPNDWGCVKGDAWGDVCAPRGSIPLPPADNGSGLEDVGQAGEDTGTVPNPSGGGNGCVAGSLPGAASSLAPFLLLMAFAALRRRRS
jgi:hypothetical protein